MTEQQEHLSNLFKQRQTLSKEIESLRNQENIKKEIFLKVQGAIEYLQQIGVTLPEPETTDALSSNETVSEPSQDS
jgi:chaperonin cofactor prefoldin